LGKLRQRWASGDVVPFSSSVTAMDLTPLGLEVYVVLQKATKCDRSEISPYTVQL